MCYIKAVKKEEKFIPRDGQVDFTNIRWAPVINCVLQFEDKILVVKRSSHMRLYPNYWTGISGFLDDQKRLEEKVYEEIKEELGLSSKDIVSITLGTIFNQEAPKYKKTWIVHPVLVKVNTNVITLDWEASTYQWLKPQEVEKLKLLPGFDQVLRGISLVE